MSTRFPGKRLLWCCSPLASAVGSMVRGGDGGDGGLGIVVGHWGPRGNEEELVKQEKHWRGLGTFLPL